MKTKYCVMATMMTAAMAMASAVMWVKHNPETSKKLKKKFNKATSNMKNELENMM